MSIVDQSKVSLTMRTTIGLSMLFGIAKFIIRQGINSSRLRGSILTSRTPTPGGEDVPARFGACDSDRMRQDDAAVYKPIPAGDTPRPATGRREGQQDYSRRIFGPEMESTERLTGQDAVRGSVHYHVKMGIKTKRQQIADRGESRCRGRFLARPGPGLSP